MIDSRYFVVALNFDASGPEVEFALLEWVDWYNNARLHQGRPPGRRHGTVCAGRFVCLARVPLRTLHSISAHAHGEHEPSLVSSYFVGRSPHTPSQPGGLCPRTPIPARRAVGGDAAYSGAPDACGLRFGPAHRSRTDRREHDPQIARLVVRNADRHPARSTVAAKPKHCTPQCCVTTPVEHRSAYPHRKCRARPSHPTTVELLH